MATSQCEECGASFTGRSDRRFCSVLCQRRVYRRDHRAEIRAGTKDWWARTKSPKPVAGVCDECGGFIAIKSAARKYCSARCNWNAWVKRHPETALESSRSRSLKWQKAHPEAKRRRRSLEMNAATEHYRDIDIFDRDRWICQLCHRPVDKQYVGHDRRAPTIDHILPLSKGGADSPANVQLAHRGCNSRKGNRASARGEQLRLVG